MRSYRCRLAKPRLGRIVAQCPWESQNAAPHAEQELPVHPCAASSRLPVAIIGVPLSDFSFLRGVACSIKRSQLAPLSRMNQCLNVPGHKPCRQRGWSNLMAAQAADCVQKPPVPAGRRETACFTLTSSDRNS